MWKEKLGRKSSTQVQILTRMKRINTNWLSQIDFQINLNESEIKKYNTIEMIKKVRGIIGEKDFRIATNLYLNASEN